MISENSLSHVKPSANEQVVEWDQLTLEEEKINEWDNVTNIFTRDWLENQRIKGSTGKMDEAAAYSTNSVNDIMVKMPC